MTSLQSTPQMTDADSLSLHYFLFVAMNIFLEFEHDFDSLPSFCHGGRRGFVLLSLFLARRCLRQTSLCFFLQTKGKDVIMQINKAKLQSKGGNMSIALKHKNHLEAFGDPDFEFTALTKRPLIETNRDT